ncbi:hypothetical protein X975_08887, partial [Stegodyphus mimosarum]
MCSFLVYGFFSHINNSNKGTNIDFIQVLTKNCSLRGGFTSLP